MARTIVLSVIIEVPDTSVATPKDFIDAFHRLVEWDTMGTEATLPEWEGVDFRDYNKED